MLVLAVAVVESASAFSEKMLRGRGWSCFACRPCREGSLGKKLLQDKVCLITGGSRGLGRALAERFVAEGARVSICGRDSAALVEAQRGVSSGEGAQVFSMVADVGVWEDARRFVLRTVDRFGALDVLVNNASILGPRVPIADYPQKEFEEVLRVNLLGPYFMAKAVVPVMAERSGGSIVNVSSGVGAVGRAEWGAYSVSKFGIEALTQILADEVREKGIRVNTVNPGRMATEMRRMAYPEEDQSLLPRPEDVTDVFVYLASDLSRGETGRRINALEFAMPLAEADLEGEEAR